MNSCIIKIFFLSVLFYCLAVGRQAVNYYRYGERKNCKPTWENLKFCLQLKSKPIDIRKVSVYVLINVNSY